MEPSIEPSGHISIDGFNLRYTIEGHGIPALVIGSHLYYPRLFSGSLKEYLQCHFIDHRGFTEPPHDNTSSADYEMDILLQDIETFRKYFGLKKFLVIGHSGHAFLALEYAKRYEQHVTGVVMIGVTPNYGAATHSAAEEFFNIEASPSRKKLWENNMASLPAQIEKDPSRRFVFYCLAAAPKTWYQEDFDASFLWEGISTNMTMIDHAWGTIFRDIDIRRGLSDLIPPVFLALGRYDFLTGPIYLWNEYMTSFNDVTRVVFPASAHNPPFEEAASFDASLLDWIRVKGILN